MSVNTAAGVPQRSGKFIPEIWSGKWNAKFYDATVFSAIANTDWQGEITGKGDKVIIRNRPDVTIRPYVKGQNLEIEHPDSDIQELLIDQADYFNVALDDIDEIQGDMKLMDAWMNDATEQMKQRVDRRILSSIYLDVAAVNQGSAAGADSGNIDLGVSGTPVVVTKSNVLDVIVDLGTVLTESNLPETERSLVIPPWMAGLIKKSDLRNASFADNGSSNPVLRNGRIGEIDGFTIYSSKHLSRVVDGANTAFRCLAMHKSALTFAAQMTKMETIRSERSFANLLRGLQVYGWEVVKPDAMALLYAVKG